MDKRSADLQAKARLLGVPLTCVLCQQMTHVGTEITVEHPDDNPPTEDAAYFLTCEKKHWHRDSRDTNKTTFDKLTMAGTCPEFEWVDQEWADGMEGSI